VTRGWRGSVEPPRRFLQVALARDGVAAEYQQSVFAQGGTPQPLHRLVLTSNSRNEQLSDWAVAGPEKPVFTTLSTAI
jgi:hypothetical protein